MNQSQTTSAVYTTKNLSLAFFRASLDPVFANQLSRQFYITTDPNNHSQSSLIIQMKHKPIMLKLTNIQKKSIAKKISK